MPPVSRLRMVCTLQLHMCIFCITCIQLQSHKTLLLLVYIRSSELVRTMLFRCDGRLVNSCREQDGVQMLTTSVVLYVMYTKIYITYKFIMYIILLINIIIT